MDTVRLILGDALTELAKLPDQSIDLILTDPPYLEGDFSWMLPELLRVGKRLVLTPGKLESFNWIRRQAPVWEYAWQSHTQSLGGRACLHIAWEPILAYAWPLRPLGADLLVYPIGLPDQKNGHVWPKPIGLMRKLVAHWTNESQMVLDPFMGSGTTGDACITLGRKFIGVEKDGGNFAIAERRIAEAQLQPSLLPNHGFHLTAAPVGLWDGEPESGAGAGEANR